MAYLETRSAPRRRLERYVARERPTDFSPAASHLFHTLASPFLIYPGHAFHAAVRPHTFTCGNFRGGPAVWVRFAKSGCHQNRLVRARTRAAHATLPGRPHAHTRTGPRRRPGVEKSKAMIVTWDQRRNETLSRNGLVLCVCNYLRAKALVRCLVVPWDCTFPQSLSCNCTFLPDRGALRRAYYTEDCS